jgi:hypothetical protein
VSRDLVREYISFVRIERGIAKNSLVSYGRKLRRATVLFAVLVLFNVFVFGQTKVSPEEYEIFNFVIKKTASVSDSRNIVVSRTTSRDPHYISAVPRRQRHNLTKLHRSTLRDFLAANKVEGEIEDEFADDLVVHLVSWEDSVNSLGRLSDEGSAVTKFGADYRLTFSRVGFNRSKSQALVHVDYRSNEMRKYAFGAYFVFSKQNGVWEMIQYARSWIY